MERKALVLDVASDFNRGDAVMQQALAKFLRNDLECKYVNAVAIHGYNEFDLAQEHFDESESLYDNIIPGIRATYNLGPKTFWTKYRNILSLLRVYLSILILPVGKVRIHYKSIKQEMLSSDIVIWNGRNFRDRKGIGEFYDLLCFVYLAFLARKLNIKLIFYGVSVWRLQYKFSERLVKLVLKKDNVLTLARESFTYEYLNELGIENMRCYDLSFHELINFENESKNRKHISYVITDWQEDGEDVQRNYLEVLKGSMIDLIERGYTIQIVPQVYPKWENYLHLLDQIIPKKYKDDVNIIEDKLSVADLMNIYSNSVLTITTRMHGAIFARFSGSRVISIAYDSGAKWYILKDLGIYHRIIDYTSLTGDKLHKMINDALNETPSEVWRLNLANQLNQEVIALKKLLK